MSARALSLAVLTLLCGAPTFAQQSKPAPVQQNKPSPAPAAPAAAKKPAVPAAKGEEPKALGRFDDWIAATYQEAGHLICYAFTRAQSSAPQLPGRGGVVLTVTQRASGRDAVALEAGFTFAPNATVTVQADKAELSFYTSKRAAFAEKGHDAVVAFQTAGRAVAHSPGPKEATLTDTFSLKGFSAAYQAISKECPPK
jgi:hypothetical protein